MAWTLEIKSKVVKFIEDLDSETKRRLKETINVLIDRLGSGVLPFKEMDIKRLAGEKEGFMRLRIGNIRLIFNLDVIVKPRRFTL